MRSPVSPALELDGAGSMVNCTIKTEEKKESGYESTPGAAPSTEPQPSDPPGPPPREGTAPPPLPQVGPTVVTNTDPGPGKRRQLFPQAVVPHPKETKLKCVVPSRPFWLLLMLSGQLNLRALPLAWSPLTTSISSASLSHCAWVFSPPDQQPQPFCSLCCLPVGTGASELGHLNK